MRSFFVQGLHGAGLAALLCTPALQVQAHVEHPADVQAQLDALQRQLAEQRALIDSMARELSARQMGLQQDASLTAEQLDAHRGTGNASEGAATQQPPAPTIGAQAGDGQQQSTRAPAANDSARPHRHPARAAVNTTTETPSSGHAHRPSPTGTDKTSERNIAKSGPELASANAPQGAATGSPQGAATRSPQRAATGGHTQPPLPSRTSAGPGELAISPVNPAANPRPYAPANARANAGSAAASPQAGPVGKPPANRGRPPEVAPLFEQPGVLTPTGKFIFEPAMQFGYSSSNRVALVGYTIIPALLIGLVDVREVKRNTTTAILSGRFGLSNRLELDVKVPYVYRSDSTVSREIFTGTAVENVFSTSGKHIGDAELGMRYQLNNGGPDRAFYVGSLRLKSRTGRDPFSVVTDCAQRCIGPNASGTGLPLDLPTGSGFYSVQPGLTWLFPSDPAVFFGSVSYLHNLKRENVSRTVLNGEQEFLGEVKPGDIIGFNFGMGLGLNEKASFSLGYDHSSIGRTRQNGVAVPGAVRTQLGTLLLGFSYRIDERRSLNVAVGAGLTRDTPDVTLTLRVPTTF